MPATDSSPSATATAKKPAANGGNPPEKKYKCQYCARAFSRSEHRSRHERSHTKERPFKCNKCRSTFVRRDLLLRHDRTVHAKDGGPPLVSESRKKTGPKTANANKKDETSRASNGDSTTQQEQDQQLLNDQAALAAAEDLKLLAGLDPMNMVGTTSSGDNYTDEMAASVIAELHNKAHAAAQLVNPPTINPLQTTTNPLPELHRATNGGQSAKQSYSPEVHFDHGNYMSGAAGSLPMPWDNFLSPSMSFNNTLPPPVPATTSNPISLPPLPTNIQTPFMERTQSQQEPLTAHLHSQLGISMDSPSRVLSPFPFLLGPVSPVDYRRSPGPSQVLVHARTPKILHESQREQIVQNLRHWDTSSPAGQFILPSKAQINDYLSTYFNHFHHHLPFLHPESFTPTETSVALLLAIMSIGALYSFHQEQAFLLHVASKLLVSQFLANKESYSSRQCPLWVMQSTLINMIFASWSGDEKGLEWACSIKSLLANMVAGNMYELKLRQEARAGAPPSLAEWIEDEGCRRTYYAVYLFYGMLTLTYNHTPALSYNEIEDLELPSSESMWNLPQPDEESWRETLESLEITTVKLAHDNLFKGVPVRYSAFATRIMINAIFLELWHHKRSSEALQNLSTENQLRLALSTWEKSLDDCLLETIRVELSAPHQGHPLIFNALAVYRNCLARFSVDLKSVQEALRYHDSYEVAAAMTNARDRVPRSPDMLKVIDVCFECLQVPVMEGIKYVGRTAATDWSIEHPLCGLDLMVILSLWLYRLEHDEESATDDELNMYNRVKNLLDIELSEAQLREAVSGSAMLSGIGGPVGPGKLSATVAKLWGDMVNEVVVWGITRIMGESFALHSQALSGYDDTDGLPSPTSPVSMSMSLSRAETGVDEYDTSPLKRKASVGLGKVEDDGDDVVQSRPMSKGMVTDE